MAFYPQPSDNTGIFNGSYFDSTSETLTIETGKKYFLSYPIAQGTENMTDVNVSGDITITGQANIDYRIMYPDNSHQDSAYTGAKAFEGSYTSANITLNNEGKITAISSGSSSTTTSFLVSPKTSYSVGKWNNITTPSTTSNIDIYTVGGGGYSGTGEKDSTFGTSIGGASGGGGGVVFNNRISFGNVSAGISAMCIPQYVSGDVNSLGNPTNNNLTAIWEGTFTQSGTTLTVVSTTSGAIVAGSIVYFSYQDYNSTYATSTTPYGAYYNQICIIGSNGDSTWLASNQGQSLPTAISGKAYMPVVLWEGTYTQSGTTITASTTTSGDFNVIPTEGNYYLVASNGVGTYTQQYITDIGSTTNNLIVNTSQNIPSTEPARILSALFGVNTICKFNNYPSYINSVYTNFPYIAWSEGGGKGEDGTISDHVFVYGTKGYGGGFVSYLGSNIQTSIGGNGAKSITNVDVDPFSAGYSYGGSSILLYNKNITIDSISINNLNQGSTFELDATSGSSVFTQFASGVGGVIIICY